MHVLHRYEEPLHDMDYTYLPLIDYELNAMPVSYTHLLRVMLRVMLRWADWEE